MDQPPLFFISWSGPEAQSIAKRLEHFISKVHPTSRLFLSVDIDAGARWASEVQDALDSCLAGVVVVTPQNKLRPWLHFEAGALSKQVEQTRVVPLLCGVAKGELRDTPLTQFQCPEIGKETVYSIVVLVGSVHGFELTDANQRENFEQWWGTLGAVLIDPAQYNGNTQDAPAKLQLEDLAAQLDEIQASMRTVLSRADTVTVEARTTSRGATPITTKTPVMFERKPGLGAPGYLIKILDETEPPDSDGDLPLGGPSR